MNHQDTKTPRAERKVRNADRLPGRANAVLVLLAIAWILAPLPPTRAATASAVRVVASANSAYAAGNYQEALEAYKQAEVDCPQCPQIAYNEGLAHYRLRDFTKAREMFSQALSTRDLDLEAKIKFNLGNASYSQALEKLGNLSEAMENATRAINHYRDALDLNPDDRDARASIEIAQLLIRDLLDKQKQEQEKEQQQQDDQEQCDNPQQQDQQDQSQEDQDQQQEQKEQESDQQEQQQGQEEKEQQQGEQQQQDQQQPQDAQEESEEQQAAAREGHELTQPEAERLLQAVRDKEAKRREELARRARARRVPVRRDW